MSASTKKHRAVRDEESGGYDYRDHYIGRYEGLIHGSWGRWVVAPGAKHFVTLRQAMRFVDERVDGKGGQS